jgi:hypothetical protein
MKTKEVTLVEFICTLDIIGVLIVAGTVTYAIDFLKI